MRIHAPDFASAAAWLNIDHPLSIAELRGQVVILDFWTYCCVNCMHVLPILRDLEERHAQDPLVVIGVHSAKFDGEKDAEHVLSAMRRYGVSHPVVVDSDMRIWSAYAVRSWPTLVVIRPDGTLAAVAPGEPDPAMLESFVQAQLDEARAHGTLQKKLALPQAAEASDGPLLYPGKVACGEGRIFVADSGHHRVLVLDETGACIDTIGSGLRGLREGTFREAALDDPQGLAFKDGALFIADARAHAVLRADLRERRLTRIAGTGELGRAALTGKGPALSTALRSPWDIAVHGEDLVIALAGSHQLALLRGETIELVAGDGREAQIDGKGTQAALAQPSGLSVAGDVVYVADSESSGVRVLDLREGSLSSLAGGPGLFDFGDKLGAIESGMLQHPLAVAATAQGVVVADTYNDKLKRFSPDGKTLEAFGPQGLSQPAGLCVLPSGEVLVADTNGHRVVRVAADGKSFGDVTITFAPKPQRGVALAPSPPPKASAAGWFTALVESRNGKGLAQGDGRIVLELSAPDGFELSSGSPWSAAVEVSRRSDLLHVTPEFAKGEATGGGSQTVVLHASASHDADIDSELILTVRAVACDARNHSACWPVQNSFRLPLRLLANGQAEVGFALPLTLPQ
ncbi:MAG TPA: thioredoxin-like domain-containing protein [Myxococcales bacterium]